MNIPTQVTASSIQATQINVGRCMLLYCAITNGGAATRYYALCDLAGAPPVGVPTPGTQGTQFQIAAGQTLKVPTVDAPHGIAFTTGCRLMAFTDAMLTTPAPADTSVVAWVAALA